MKMKTAYMMMALAAALAARAEYQYVFDTSGAPELAEWTATNLAPVVREWYPKLVEMFPSEGWTAPEKVSFRYREGLPHPAHTVKDEVTTLRSWYTDNPGDVGCAVHELFHVVQGGYRRAPGWLTEGIADYVRWYLFEPGSHGCDMDVKSGSCRYNGSYRVSANFLNFVETRYPGTVRELNALCRQGKYDEKAYWLRRTGRSVLELEDEWKGRRGAAKAPAVRVMTYNIRCEGGDRKSPENNWGARRDDLVDLVRRENPDVAGFQEVEPGQLKWLAGRFADYTFVGVGRNASRP